MRRMLSLYALAFMLLVLSVDAQTYRWDYFAKLIYPRRNYPALNHCAVFAPCKVLVAGGYTGGNSGTYGQATKKCEIIDVCCRKVSETGEMNYARSEHILLTTPDSNVIAISGLTQITNEGSFTGTHTTTVELYNRSTGTWSVIGNTNVGRRQAQGVFISNTEVFIIGGRLTDLSTLASAEIFDLSTGTSTNVASAPMAINMHVVGTASNGDVIIAAGRNGGTDATRTPNVYRYNRATNTYTQVGTLPSSVRSPSMRKLFSGNLLISGGLIQESGPNIASYVVLENGGSYSSVGNTQYPRWGHGIGQISSDSSILFGGGGTSLSNTRAECEWYSQSLSAITPAPTLPKGLASFDYATVPMRYNTNGTVRDASVLVIGGVSGASEMQKEVPRDTIFILQKCLVPDSIRNSRITNTCLSYKFAIDSINLCRDPSYIRWSFGDSTSANTQPWTTTHTYPRAGAYNVKATLLYANCADSLVLQKTITINSTANITAAPRLLIRCAGDTGIVLRANGGVRYRWTPSQFLSDSTSANPIAKPTKDMKYYVTGWTADSCVGMDSMIVRYNIADAGADQTLCSSSDSVVLSVSVASSVRSVRWTPKQGLGCDTCIMTRAKPAATTKYIATVVDTSGCVVSDTVQVSVRNGVQAKVSPASVVTLCATSDSLTLSITPKTGVRNVRWTPNIAINCDTCMSAKVKPKATLKYTVFVTDSSGCLSIDTILVKVGAGSSSIQSGPAQFICFKGDSAIINVNGRIKSIQWIPATDVACPSCPSTVVRPTSTRYFKYIADDSSGCTNTDSIKVTVLPKSTVDISPDTTICGSTPLLLNVFGSYQVIQWSPINGLSCANCPTVLVTPTPGKTVTYYVTAHNGNSSDCDSRDSVRVRFAPGIENQLFDQQICPGDSIVVNLRKFGGKVSWSPSASFKCDTCRSIVIKPTKNGKYILTGDSLGCISRDTMNVAVAVTTLSTPKALSTCSGQALVLYDTTNATEIHWSPPDELSCTDCPNPIARPTQSRMYYVTAGKGACAKTDSIFVSVKPAPVFTAYPLDTVLCNGTSLQLHVNVSPAGSTVEWNANSDLSCYNCSDPIAKPSSNNVWYYAKVRTPGGCDSTISVHIRTTQPPVFSLSATSNSICEGDSVDLRITTTATAQFRWRTLDSSATNLSCDTCLHTIARPLKTVSYIVDASSAVGCATVDTIAIVVLPRPSVSISPDTSQCVGVARQLFVRGGSIYQWSNDQSLSCNDCPNPIATPLSSTTYKVRVLSAAGGCWRDTSVSINTVPCTLKPRIQSSALAPFFACDATQSEVIITNEGDVVLRVDSIGLKSSNHAFVRASDIAKVNAMLPTYLKPQVDTLRFTVQLSADQSGLSSVDLNLYLQDSTRSLRFNLNTYKREIQLSLPPLFNLKADTIVSMNISASSLYWNDLKIQDSAVLRLHIDSTALEYVDVQAGSALPATWSVQWDSLQSSSSIIAFILRGTTPINGDGVYLIPRLRTLLPRTRSSACSVEALFPSLRIDCADQQRSNALLNFNSCAFELRQIALKSSGFALNYIHPNPSRHSIATLNYSVGTESQVELRLYTSAGKEVDVLACGRHSSGVYELDLKTDSLATGEYFIQMLCGAQRLTQKLVVEH